MQNTAGPIQNRTGRICKIRRVNVQHAVGGPESNALPLEIQVCSLVSALIFAWRKVF